MIIEKFKFEKSPKLISNNILSDSNISLDDKYENGYSRVITENGSYKVALLKDTFQKENYNLQPEYQRRIRWTEQKRSKLIESLIINIPIPPIFLYEYDYDKYEVMDGLQRLTAIIDFYDNKYRLSGLIEWSELNGKYYEELPDKIKEGIGRRQLPIITLLKESAKDEERAERIKRLVFERLNTGGIKLNGQEIRNAIYPGRGNDLCMRLSENSTYRKLWGIVEINDDSVLEEQDFQYIDDDRILKNSLYKRMGDVELVLRFFAMRYIDDFTYSLSDFLDDTLINLNTYTDNDLEQLGKLFNVSVSNANRLFGDKAFQFYDGKKWGSATRMIYDPLMQVLSQIDLENKEYSIDNNINKLEKFYKDANKNINELQFNGKQQSKDDIKDRMDSINKFVTSVINGQ